MRALFAVLACAVACQLAEASPGNQKTLQPAVSLLSKSGNESAPKTKAEEPMQQGGEDEGEDATMQQEEFSEGSKDEGDAHNNQSQVVLAGSGDCVQQFYKARNNKCSSYQNNDECTDRYQSGVPFRCTWNRNPQGCENSSLWGGFGPQPKLQAGGNDCENIGEDASNKELCQRSYVKKNLACKWKEKHGGGKCGPWGADLDREPRPCVAVSPAQPPPPPSPPPPPPSPSPSPPPSPPPPPPSPSPSPPPPSPPPPPPSPSPSPPPFLPVSEVLYHMVQNQQKVMVQNQQIWDAVNTSLGRAREAR